MSAVTIYLLDLLGNIQEVSTAVSIVAAFTFAGLVIAAAIIDEGDAEAVASTTKYVRTSLIVTVVFGALAIVIPTKKTLALMITVPYITNLKGVDELPSNTVKLLNKLLEDATKEKE